MAKTILPKVNDYFECSICGSTIYFCSNPFTHDCIGAVCFGYESNHIYFGSIHFNHHVRHFNKYILPNLYGEGRKLYHKPHLMDLVKYEDN